MVSSIDRTQASSHENKPDFDQRAQPSPSAEEGPLEIELSLERQGCVSSLQDEGVAARAEMGSFISLHP